MGYYRTLGMGHGYAIYELVSQDTGRHTKLSGFQDDITTGFMGLEISLGSVKLEGNHNTRLVVYEQEILYQGWSVNGSHYH